MSSRKWGTAAVAAMALFVMLLGSGPLKADTIDIRNQQCRIHGYSAYADLAYFHIYDYVATYYLQIYLARPTQSNIVYFQIYASYKQLAYNFYFNYWYGMMRLEACERPPIKVTTVTSTSVSVRTQTAANGSVFTVTSYSTSVKTATSTY